MLRVILALAVGAVTTTAAPISDSTTTTTITSDSTECGLKSLKFADYRGSLATTVSGRECMRWDQQFPHKHSVTNARYPESGLDENYCRNPDGEPNGAWCYTTDAQKRWEYCSLPQCDDDSPPTNTQCGTTWADNGTTFLGQKDYRGTVAKTVSGRDCMRWDQQEPHKHSRTYEKYPYSGLEENFCRNPDDEGEAWCYTTDKNKRWEFCGVTTCDEGPPSAPSFCYDYSSALTMDISVKECTTSKMYNKIKDVYNTQREASDDKNCKGGLNRELMALTRTTSYDDAYAALSNMCEEALQQASESAESIGWEMLEKEGLIDLEEFYAGDGFLNEETGNFQQEANDFVRGGKKKFIYMGNDPRLNDYVSTTEKSYKAGTEIFNVYKNEASSSFLTSPTTTFKEESCAGSNAAVCCWSRDRQYFDNNGNCHEKDCAEQNPGDNTDLCWTQEDGEVFPYPNDDVEEDLHCHGFAWAHDEAALGDINTKARFNNLFFVSMYDHMYQRGYVDSITDDPLIAGEQAMCGCVEDMNPVARADCTEVIGRTNYTAFQDGMDGPLVIRHVPSSFHLEFRACQGYDYVEDFTPDDYTNPSNAADLEASDNDLAAFVFRLYLEGKIDEQHVNTIEQTIIGYRDPSVNDGDAEREVACQAAFKNRYPDLAWAEREI